MKMMKRILGLLLALVLVLSVFPAAAFASGTLVEVEITDAVNGASYTVTSLETGESGPFSYAMPEGDVTVLFFFSYTCGNCAATFNDLADEAWLGSEKLHLVAVESNGATAEQTRACVERELGAARQHFNVYYGNSSLQWVYARYLGLGGSITWPLILVIRSEGGANVLRYAGVGAWDAEDIRNSVAHLLEGWEINHSYDVVTTRVSGVAHYEWLAEELRQLNAARAEQGLPALVLSNILTEYAMQRAAECAVYYSHTRPSEEDCFSVGNGGAAYGAATGGYLNAENIGVGYMTVSEAMSGWLNSPGHYANIMNTNSGSVGFGVFESQNEYYVVQLFGTRSGDALPPLTTPVERIVAVDCLRMLVEEDVGGYRTEPMSLNVGESAYFELSAPNWQWYYTHALVPVDQTVTDAAGRTIAELKDGVLTALVPGTGTVKIEVCEGLGTSFTLTVAGGGTLPYDLDCDGDEDAADAACLFRLVSEGADAPDVNGDGKGNNRDAIGLFRSTAG